MNIVFLHGKLSTPETSETVAAVKEYFGKIGYDVFIPDYKPNESSYTDIKSFLKDYINMLSLEGKEIIIIGISLGGYWAFEMANSIPDCSCVLLNPSLNYYGIITNPEIGLPISLFVNLDDEIVDSNVAIKILKDRAFIRTYPKGGHRMSNIKSILPEIERSVFNFVL